MSNLETFCYNDGVDNFWSTVSDAIAFKLGQGNTEIRTKSRGDTFLLKLQSYLELSEAFKSFVSQTRSSYFTVNSSNLAAPSLLTKRMSIPSNKRGASSTLKLANASSLSSSAPSELLSQASDSILHDMAEMTSLISKVLEITDTLAQYMKLVEDNRLRGLPRFSGLWAFLLPYSSSEEGDENESSLNQSFNQSDMQAVCHGAESVKSGAENASSSSLATEDCLDMFKDGNYSCIDKDDGKPVNVPLQFAVNHPGPMSVLKEESWVYNSDSGTLGYNYLYLNDPNIRNVALFF